MILIDICFQFMRKCDSSVKFLVVTGIFLAASITRSTHLHITRTSDQKVWKFFCKILRKRCQVRNFKFVSINVKRNFCARNARVHSNFTLFRIDSFECSSRSLWCDMRWFLYLSFRATEYGQPGMRQLIRILLCTEFTWRFKLLYCENRELQGETREFENMSRLA